MRPVGYEAVDRDLAMLLSDVCPGAEDRLTSPGPELATLQTPSNGVIGRSRCPSDWVIINYGDPVADACRSTFWRALQTSAPALCRPHALLVRVASPFPRVGPTCHPGDAFVLLNTHRSGRRIMSTSSTRVPDI